MNRTVIGTDARISLADFTGKFVDLAPWQRDLIETIAAIPPDQREKVVIVGNHDGRDYPAHWGIGHRGDRIIIDDPWADKAKPIDMEAATRLFLDGLPPLIDGIDPVIIMSRMHDEPALKLAEAQRYEQIECRKVRAAELAQPIGPGNRADRRAQLSREMRKVRRPGRRRHR